MLMTVGGRLTPCITMTDAKETDETMMETRHDII